MTISTCGSREILKKIDVVIVFIANDVISLWQRHIVMTSFPVGPIAPWNTEFYRRPIASLVSDNMVFSISVHFY